MAFTARKKVETDVETWFNQHPRRAYQTKLNQIRDALEAFREIREREGKRPIHLVFSRKDTQGDELKINSSIVDKILDKERINPEYRVCDLTDIIGVTLACPFPSDASEVTAALPSYLNGNGYTFVEPVANRYPDKIGEDGYVATHFVIFPNNDPEYKCEIQVKTMLHIGWDAKAHDLTYKGTKVGLQYRQETKYLSELLSQVDQFSETLRDRIESKKKEDREFKDAITIRELDDLTTESARALESDDRSTVTEVQELLKRSPPDVERASELVDELLKRRGSNVTNLSYFLRTLLPLSALIALKDSRRKFQDKSFRLGEKLLNSSKNEEETARAHLDIAFLNYCFNRFGDAVEEAEVALEKTRNPTFKSDAANDLAYYIAENLYERRSMAREGFTEAEALSQSEKAERLAEEALNSARKSGDKLVEDISTETMAFVKAVIGDSPAKMFEGLTLYQPFLENEKNPLIGYARRGCRIGYERLADFMRYGHT